MTIAENEIRRMLSEALNDAAAINKIEKGRGYVIRLQLTENQSSAQRALRKIAKDLTR